MRVPEYNYERLTIEFEHAEVAAMLGKDEEKLSEFAEMLDKYIREIDDAKKLRTKEILQRAKA